MKRAKRIAQLPACLVRPPFSLYNPETVAEPSGPIRYIYQDATQTSSSIDKETVLGKLATLFNNRLSYNRAPLETQRQNRAGTIAEDDLRGEVARLRDEILAHKEDSEKIEKILEENGVSLFRKDGSAIVQLLNHLHEFPSLVMEVLGWRRKQLDYAAPMTVDEYAKAIVIAGRMNDLDAAVELFKEACNKQLKGTSLFNALMTAYVGNGLIKKCQSVFQDLKRESTCAPSIASYNILISSLGGLMLVDHMEAVFKEIIDLNLTPTIHTYRGLISGYITAWMWEEMEKTYLLMKDGPVKPDLDIHLLMLRGYALAGELEKMEEVYDMVSYHVDDKGSDFIRNMIYAYCRSSNADRVQRIQELLRKIPKSEHRPGLDVELIRFYAKEGLLEQMENSIDEAFEHKTNVASSGVMRRIAACYFKHNAVDRLAEFVERAELGGWKRCRYLYHTKMVMYGSERRLSEMEGVISEMGRRNIHVSSITLLILCKVYKRWGERNKLKQVIAVMHKNGYITDYGALDSM